LLTGVALVGVGCDWSCGGESEGVVWGGGAWGFGGLGLDILGRHVVGLDVFGSGGEGVALGLGDADCFCFNCFSSDWIRCSIMMSRLISSSLEGWPESADTFSGRSSWASAHPAVMPKMETPASNTVRARRRSRVDRARGAMRKIPE
jgi:hypothetical protein